jgi:hypothetical protein
MGRNGFLALRIQRPVSALKCTHLEISAAILSQDRPMREMSIQTKNASAIGLRATAGVRLADGRAARR